MNLVYTCPRCWSDNYLTISNNHTISTDMELQEKCKNAECEAPIKLIVRPMMRLVGIISDDAAKDHFYMPSVRDHFTGPGFQGESNG